MTFPKRPFLTAGVALLAAALNAQSTALTWRHETVSYPTPRAPGIPSNLAVDDSENVYVVINDPSQEGPTALRKYDMFGNVFIAPPLPFSTDVADTLRVCASPTIAGQQYVYVLEFPAAPNGAVNAQKYLCTNRQVPPSSVWTAPFHFSAPNGYAWQPAGCYIDSQGLIYLALGLEGDSHHTSHELKLLKLDANGRILRNFDVPLIAPGDDPVELSGYLPRAHQDLYERAAFSPGLHKWIIEGDSLIGGFLTTSARWGVYDPETGSETFNETANIAADASGTFQPFFITSALPNGSIGVAKNIAHYPPGSPYPDFFITSVQVLNPDLSVAWRSPSTGTAKGMVLDIESAGPQQPIYVGGTPRFLDIYDWNGILLQALNDAPADVLFPNSDGLNTVSYAAYLEHFDGVTFDWGQSYWGTQEPESVNIAGYAPKYNALYFMVYGTGLVQTSFEQGPILEYRWRIERYIQGVWLKSISAPNAVQGGHSLPVTITLNRPPPRWPYIVGLISPSPALLMPNGTQKQNFYIPAGQNFWTVNLNAQPVAASISMRLVVTQDGIYVSAPITVTP